MDRNFRKMTRNGREYRCEVLKQAHLSTGYSVYLLKRELTPYCNPYVVGVRKDGETVSFDTYITLPLAFTYYLDMLACYA